MNCYVEFGSNFVIELIDNQDHGYVVRFSFDDSYYNICGMHAVEKYLCPVNVFKMLVEKRYVDYDAFCTA